MGREARRSRLILTLLREFRWWQRIQVWLKFADVPNPPRQLRGVNGGRYVLFGEVASRRRAH